MLDEDNNIENVNNSSNSEVCECKNGSTKSDTNSKSCKCGDRCNCKNNGCKCKNCLPVFLSALACVISITALLKTCNKSCTSAKPVQTTAVNESKIRSTIIDVIKNDPQMLIDAMSAGIVKQRSDMAKQQALEVNKNKDEIIAASYKIGDADVNTSVLCFFDPLCGGCIEFQRIMVDALQQKKAICFYLIPVAVLGAKSEELAKFYYEVASKDKNKLLMFISELVKDPSDVERALEKISISKSDLMELESVANEKMSSNLALFDKIHATAVPAMFIKSKSGNFTAIDEEELIARLS